MILLYANESEVRYVTYEPKYCIGYRAEDLDKHIDIIGQADEVILFGCSGYTGLKNIAWNRLYTQQTFPYVHCRVDEEWVDNFRYTNDMLVDLESYHVYNLCKEMDVPFKSIRYIIDRCDRRCVPRGINHFWRKYQHRRMQLMFNKYLEGK